MNIIKLSLILSVAAIALTGLLHFSRQESAKPNESGYQIIYLNGPSSTGKSRLVRALQAKLDEPYMHIGIDKLIGMMPPKFNNWEGGAAPLGFSWKATVDEDGSVIQELQTGPFARKVIQSYKEVVKTLARQGHCLIIDDVAFGKDAVDEWRKQLENYKVLYVGLHAPLPVLEQRERERGDRIIGSARAQFKNVHQGVAYDLELDTFHDTLEENVAKVMQRMTSLTTSY